MRWEDERYVKLYTRDTGDWLFLSFDAQALLMMILRKVDRAGILHLGHHGKDALASIVGHTESRDRVAPALEQLVADGCIQVDGEKLVIPNFIEAQEAKTNDAQRKRDQRERDRDKLVAEGIRGNAVGLDETAKLERAEKPARERASKSQPVTPRVTASHAMSRTVTPNHAVPSCTEPSLAEPEQIPVVTKIATIAAAKTPLPPTTPTWDSYSEAYEKRHGVRPADGKAERGKLMRFVEKVPKAEAPEIAAFYLTHNDALYIRAKHPIDLLLRDAQKLRTEWMTRRQVTGAEARQIEKTQTNADGWGELLSPEARARNGMG
jgi:hypothetical protein